MTTQNTPIAPTVTAPPSDVTQNALAAMMAQYEANATTGSSEKKVYDLKNYFTTHIEPKVLSATKRIRILPTADGSTPFVEFYGHKIQRCKVV